jgi:thioredoxin
MAEALTLTDSTLDPYLNGAKPLLVIVTSGDGLRGDFSTQFRKAAAEQTDVVFARVDPQENPRAAALFKAGDKPVLVAWSGGQEIARRVRPWGADVIGALDLLKAAAAAAPAAAPNGHDGQSSSESTTQPKESITMDTTPVNVSDGTFQQDVIDYSDTMPVVVDFWAPWCGPCRMVGPILDKLAKEFAGQVRIAKVNVDENPMISQTFNIMSIPTIMMLKEKTIVFSQPGALPEPALRDLFGQLIKLEIPKEAAEGEESPEN